MKGEISVSKIERFEDIIAWQKARHLTKEIYTSSRIGPFARDFGLRDQIQRASVSTMSNIAEGFERGGDKEFIQFLSNSKGSCGEVRSHLYVAFDQSYLTQAKFDSLYAQTTEVSRLIAGFMAYLRESDLRGRKFRQPR
jgi:four helix bundle protein